MLKSVYNTIEKDDSFKNANFEYVIKNIACKYQEKGSLIFVINSSLDATVNGERTHLPDKIIGISNDNGLTWKFVTIDEDLTKPVLSQSFDLNTVAEVLNCK